MVRGLVLLVGATLAQQQQPAQAPSSHRPWNRLGERLGFPTAPELPKPVADAIATAKEFVDRAIPSKAETPAVGTNQDTHGCMLGGGYTWCEEKNKCLREWEEPCKAEVSTPVCAENEVICTTELQKQGMNCVVGNCVKAPIAAPQQQASSSSSSMRAMAGRKDPNGCVLGAGYTWCESKKKCLRQWEETCEASTTNVAVCADGEVVCTALLQKQGMNCAIGKCVSVPSSKPQAFGGTKDAHGCVTGGGYQWCESKKKCTRQWEEACEAEAPQTVALGGTQDEHGCVKGGGYQWCEGKQKCLRSWEEACEEEVPQPVGGAQDNHGCVSGGGYQWCEGKQKCLRSWEEACEEQAPEQVGGAQDNHGCVSGGGYQWCEGKQKCLRMWEEACEEEAKPATIPVPTQLSSALSPAQKEEVEKFMNEVQTKQARYMTELKQKMADLNQNEAFKRMSDNVRERMNRVSAMLNPEKTEKIGAHEGRRVDPVANKGDAVVERTF